MAKDIEKKKLCPWCEAALILVEEQHQGSHSKMRVKRCSNCNKIISTRAEGAPDRILQTELIEGGLS